MSLTHRSTNLPYPPPVTVVHAAAKALRSYVEAEARESTGDVFSRTMSDVSASSAPARSDDLRTGVSDTTVPGEQ